MACSGCQFSLCRQFTYWTIFLPTMSSYILCLLSLTWYILHNRVCVMLIHGYMDKVIGMLQVNLQVDSSRSGGVKQVCNEWQQVAILLHDFVNAWKSMHSQRLPSSFFTKRTGKPHRDLVGQMKPFCVFLSRNLQSATSSGGDKEYIGPEIGFAPSSSVIPRSYGL